MSAAASTRSTSFNRRWVTECLALAVLAVVAVWLIFGELGAASFHDGDEALYASVSRAMVERGDFVTPTYWGRPFLHKPPLPYWLMALASATVPGPPEFQARVPSALAALALLAVTYVFARRLAGFGPALLGTAVLLANHQFLFEHAARSASFDSLLTLFMFAALLAGLSAPSAVSYRWLFPVFLGAVGLVKLPMVVFPLVIVLTHRRLAGERFALRELVRMAAIAAAVALPWHLHQALVHGREFWNAYFVYEMFGRAGATLRDPAAHTFIHLEAAWKAFLPLSPLLLLSLVGVAVGWPRTRADEPAGTARAVALYGVTLFVFFCFIPSKWPWYGIPAYPAVAVALAVFTRRAFNSSLRVALPGLFALVCGLGFFFLQADGAYAPAARPSYLWPVRTHFYSLDPALHGVSGVLIGAALVLLALLPFMRSTWNQRGFVVGGSATAAALVLGLQFAALGRVPRSSRSAVSRLAATLGEHRIQRIYSVGFFHEDRYAGRQEPLSSYYLLGVKGAQVTDCGDSFVCLPDGPSAAASAIVLRERALGPGAQQSMSTRLAGVKEQFEIWVVSPDSANGFEAL